MALGRVQHGPAVGVCSCCECVPSRPDFPGVCVWGLTRAPQPSQPRLLVLLPAM